MKRVHVMIFGDVQGVGFRAWVRERARAAGLTGWVKNRDDGTVEVVAEGSKEALEELVKVCRQGPDLPASGYADRRWQAGVAWVAKVDVTWEHATNEFVAFDIVY